ncbi:hypothetical protein LIER_34350 [Lithospermum erythrorhizon]|uniref:Uncharacterized protein n=1 Tax=Lithospermum erythrorhizon TaxID=34254 RepID=A0AAV3S2Z9_LITER
MNFQSFDLNVPIVSNHRTCYIDLNKILDNINPDNVLFDQNEFVVDMSENYPGNININGEYLVDLNHSENDEANSPNLLIDLEQLLEEENEEEEVHVYENHLELFLEEEEEKEGEGGGHSN